MDYIVHGVTKSQTQRSDFHFSSRVEWCACFVSWCYGQMGLSEPRFAACQSQGIPWFQSHGQWGGRDYANIAPGDAIFFDWDLDGSADHVGLVVGTDGSRVYTVRAREIPSLFSHTRPNGTSCFTAISEAGIAYRTAGENIAYGQRSADEVMEAWMNSSGHRANILGKDFAYIGVGVVYENGTYYWTQFFAASDDLSGEVVTTASTAAPTTVPSMTTTVPVTTVSTTSSETVSREETEPTSAVYPREIAGEAPCDETADGCGEDRGDRIRTLVNLLREKLLRQNGSCQ